MPALALEHILYENSPEPSYLLRRDFSIESSYALKDAPSALTLIDMISARVRARAGSLANARMNSELETILGQLGVALAETGIDIGSASPLEIIDAEDGSVLIEWHLVDRRLGFNIEPLAGQSGWYFAFSRESGGQCGAGLLTSLDMKGLLKLMFTKNP
jgi:hypothetical protein